jgi:perosamine synthetase
MIRLMVPSIDAADIAAVSQVLESGFLVQGSHVQLFEQGVADYLGVDPKRVVAVSNCTAALHLSLIALGVRPGDLVLVTAYSWPATANVVELCGAQPVFVDIERDTFNMDPEALQVTLDRLMSNSETARRVKAVIPVHCFGQMATMDAITSLAEPHHLSVIEDAACALGASLDGKMAGTCGTFGCFSFHPRKAITTGEGGVVVTERASDARTIRALRNHGLDSDAPSPDFILPGFNYRMTEFQAALGSTQMSKISGILNRRRELAAEYDKLLTGSDIKPPAVARGRSHVYQSYVAQLPKQCAPGRSSIIERMKARGIETTIGTWHMPLTSFYRSRYGYREGDYPIADDLFTRALTLPLHEALSGDEQQDVVRTLLEEVRKG